MARKLVCSPGQRYGKLTIVSRHGTGKLGVILWNCICDCGNSTIARQGNLRTGHTSSCGCITTKGRVTTDPGHAGCQKLFSNYKNSAKKRNLEFSLTKNEFVDLITKDCFYCGVKPSRISSVKVNSEEAELNSRFYFNGIDRINSELGYTLQNCTSCCYDCNVAKFENTQQEFYSWVSKVYNHLVETKQINISSPTS